MWMGNDWQEGKVGKGKWETIVRKEKMGKDRGKRIMLCDKVAE
jgi:hypothetical protein